MLGLYSFRIVEKMEGCLAKKAIANVGELTYEILSTLTFPFLKKPALCHFACVVEQKQPLCLVFMRVIV